MTTSVKCRPQERTLGMVMKEVDEDLAMFLEMRRTEMGKNDQLPTHNSEELDPPLGSEIDFCLLSNGISTRPANQAAAGDYLLNSENDKSDYDWLFSPPRSPSHPSLVVEDQNIASSKIVMDGSSTVQSCKIETDSSATAPESKISIEQDLVEPEIFPEEPSQINLTKQPAISRSKNSSANGGKKATSTRSATPTGRPRSSGSKPSRASTPTSRATLPSAKPVSSTTRSSTPTRAASRSSTPTSRPSNPAASKATSRSATPTRRATTPSSIPIVSMSSGRSSSLTKTGTTTLKKNAPSRGPSPTVKSRPLKPSGSETPSNSQDSSVNSKMLVPKRPASASRGRPTALGTRPSTTSSSTNGKPRRKSSSPSRGRAASVTDLSNALALLSKSRGHVNEKDDVNPVLIGTKSVERVVNMRKLAPPKQDDNLSNDNPPKKSSLSRENSGFGRSFSKNSLDMALRHMDIRRSVNGTLHPVLTRVSTSSANNGRPSSTKNKTGSVSDSPLATSSNASSDPSANSSSNNINWSELDDFGCDRELSSPSCQQHMEQ